MDERYEDSGATLTRTRSRRFHTKGSKNDKRDSVDLETGVGKPLTPVAPATSSSSRFGFFASDKYRTLTPIRRHKTPAPSTAAGVSKDADSGRPSPLFGKSSSRRGTQGSQGGMTIGAPSGSGVAGLSSLQPSFDDGVDEEVALPLFTPRTTTRIQRPEDSIFRNSIGFNTDVSISQYWSRAISISSPSKNKRTSKRLDSRSLKILEGGWEQHFDESSGRIFYYNKETGGTRWDLPEGVTATAHAYPGAESIYGLPEQQPTPLIYSNGKWKLSDTASPQPTHSPHTSTSGAAAATLAISKIATTTTEEEDDDDDSSTDDEKNNNNNETNKESKNTVISTTPAAGAAAEGEDAAELPKEIIGVSRKEWAREDIGLYHSLEALPQQWEFDHLQRPSGIWVLVGITTVMQTLSAQALQQQGSGFLSLSLWNGTRRLTNDAHVKLSKSTVWPIFGPLELGLTAATLRISYVHEVPRALTSININILPSTTTAAADGEVPIDGDEGKFLMEPQVTLSGKYVPPCFTQRAHTICIEPNAVPKAMYATLEICGTPSAIALQLSAFTRQPCLAFTPKKATATGGAPGSISSPMNSNLSPTAATVVVTPKKSSKKDKHHRKESMLARDAAVVSGPAPKIVLPVELTPADCIPAGANGSHNGGEAGELRNDVYVSVDLDVFVKKTRETRELELPEAFDVYAYAISKCSCVAGPTLVASYSSLAPNPADFGRFAKARLSVPRKTFRDKNAYVILCFVLSSAVTPILPPGGGSTSGNGATNTMPADSGSGASFSSADRGRSSISGSLAGIGGTAGFGGSNSIGVNGMMSLMGSEATGAAGHNGSIDSGSNSNYSGAQASGNITPGRRQQQGQGQQQQQQGGSDDSQQSSFEERVLRAEFAHGFFKLHEKGALKGNEKELMVKVEWGPAKLALDRATKERIPITELLTASKSTTDPSIVHVPCKNFLHEVVASIPTTYTIVSSNVLLSSDAVSAAVQGAAEAVASGNLEAMEEAVRACTQPSALALLIPDVVEALQEVLDSEPEDAGDEPVGMGNVMALTPLIAKWTEEAMGAAASPALQEYFFRDFLGTLPREHLLAYFAALVGELTHTNPAKSAWAMYCRAACVVLKWISVTGHLLPALAAQEQEAERRKLRRTKSGKKPQQQQQQKAASSSSSSKTKDSRKSEDSKLKRKKSAKLRKKKSSSLSGSSSGSSGSSGSSSSSSSSSGSSDSSSSSSSASMALSQSVPIVSNAVAAAKSGAKFGDEGDEFAETAGALLDALCSSESLAESLHTAVWGVGCIFPHVLRYVPVTEFSTHASTLLTAAREARAEHEALGRLIAYLYGDPRAQGLLDEQTDAQNILLGVCIETVTHWLKDTPAALETAAAAILLRTSYIVSEERRTDELAKLLSLAAFLALNSSPRGASSCACTVALLHFFDAIGRYPSALYAGAAAAIPALVDTSLVIVRLSYGCVTLLNYLLLSARTHSGLGTSGAMDPIMAAAAAANNNNINNNGSNGGIQSLTQRVAQAVLRAFATIVRTFVTGQGSAWFYEPTMPHGSLLCVLTMLVDPESHFLVAQEDISLALQLLCDVAGSMNEAQSALSSSVVGVVMPVLFRVLNAPKGAYGRNDHSAALFTASYIVICEWRESHCLSGLMAACISWLASFVFKDGNLRSCQNVANEIKATVGAILSLERAGAAEREASSLSPCAADLAGCEGLGGRGDSAAHSNELLRALTFFYRYVADIRTKVQAVSTQRDPGSDRWQNVLALFFRRGTDPQSLVALSLATICATLNCAEAARRDGDLDTEAHLHVLRYDIAWELAAYDPAALKYVDPRGLVPPADGHALLRALGNFLELGDYDSCFITTKRMLSDALINTEQYSQILNFIYLCGTSSLPSSYYVLRFDGYALPPTIDGGIFIYRLPAPAADLEDLIQTLRAAYGNDLLVYLRSDPSLGPAFKPARSVSISPAWAIADARKWAERITKFRADHCPAVPIQYLPTTEFISYFPIRKTRQCLKLTPQGGITIATLNPQPISSPSQPSSSSSTSGAKPGAAASGSSITVSALVSTRQPIPPPSSSSSSSSQAPQSAAFVFIPPPPYPPASGSGGDKNGSGGGDQSISAAEAAMAAARASLKVAVGSGPLGLRHGQSFSSSSSSPSSPPGASDALPPPPSFEASQKQQQQQQMNRAKGKPGVQQYILDGQLAEIPANLLEDPALPPAPTPIVMTSIGVERALPGPLKLSQAIHWKKMPADIVDACTGWASYHSAYIMHICSKIRSTLAQVPMSMNMSACPICSQRASTNQIQEVENMFPVAHSSTPGLAKFSSKNPAIHYILTNTKVKTLNDINHAYSVLRAAISNALREEPMIGLITAVEILVCEAKRMDVLHEKVEAYARKKFLKSGSSARPPNYDTLQIQRLRKYDRLYEWTRQLVKVLGYALYQLDKLALATGAGDLTQHITWEEFVQLQWEEVTSTYEIKYNLK